MKRLVTYALCGVILAFLLLPAGVIKATELIWTPINPSFGGSPFNGDWLLASAQAQSKHVEKAAPYTAPTRDPLEDFESRLNSQILYRLSRQIVDEAFGEEDMLPEGETEAHYTIGDFTVDISPTLRK